MSDESNDQINIGDVSNSQAIAAGRNAQANVTNIYNLPEYRPDAVYNLPPPNPHFVGRVAQLEAIAENFASAANPLVVTQAIAGLGGVGKTQLALAYAHTRRDQYDMLWLLRATDTLTLDTDLRLLGEALGLPLLQEKDAATVRALVLSELGSSAKRWLLLYDNADAMTPRELRPYLPGGGHVLITSRRAAAHWQNLGQTLSLDTFTEAEAAAFWQERGLADDDAQAELAQALGTLPLALEQAAAFMQMQQLPATKYLAWFREARDSLWAEEEAPADYPKTVATTWQLGFEHARKRKGAAELLNLCCFLDPDGIPLELIKQVAILEPPVGARRDAPLHESPLLEVVADERQLGLALTALRDYSLLSQAEDGTVTLHRLVQTVARDRMGPEHARAWVEVAVDLLRKAYRYDKHDMRTWETAGKLIPHMTIATKLATQYGCETINTAYLNNRTGFYVDSRGRFAAALPYYKRALIIHEKTLGLDHPDTATSLNNLGLLLQAMSDLTAARPYLERALTIREKTLGPDHPNTAHSLNNLGLLLQDLGDLAAARPYLERTLTIFEKELGPEHPDTATSLNNLGFLSRAVGDLASARVYFQRALDICEKELGPNHPDTALSLNNLGFLLQETGDRVTAQPYLERALTIREKVLGPDHPDTAQSLNNLGLLLQNLNNLAAARPFYERALAISEKALGPDHPDTAIGLNNLAVLAYYEGNYAESARLMRQALAIREKRLGPDHPDTVSSRNDLAEIEAKLP